MTKKDGQNKDNLEELMKSATEKTDDKIIDEPSKKGGSKKVVVFSIIGLLVFLGVLGVGALVMNKNNDFEDKTAKPDWVGKEKEEEIEEDDEVLGYPIELYSWAKNPYSDDFWEQEGIDDLLSESLRENASSFSRSIAWMPTAKESQYDIEGLAPPSTNDVEQRYVMEDGDEVENPLFSYALQEDYEKAFIIYTEMLLNPVFGDWGGHLSGTSVSDNTITYNHLKPMFTEKWWTDNVESKGVSTLPIMTEWDDSNWDYNFKEDEPHKLFFGRIVETDERLIISEELGTDEENQPIIKVTLPVEYYAFDKDDEVFSIEGVLNLTLQSNIDDFGSKNRVLINDASFSLE